MSLWHNCDIVVMLLFLSLKLDIAETKLPSTCVTSAMNIMIILFLHLFRVQLLFAGRVKKKAIWNTTVRRIVYHLCCHCRHQIKNLLICWTAASQLSPVSCFDRRFSCIIRELYYCSLRLVHGSKLLLVLRKLVQTPGMSIYTVHLVTCMNISHINTDMT